MLRWPIPIAALLLLGACDPLKRHAFEQLQVDGMKNVVLSNRTANGVYRFTSEQGAYTCKGHVQVQEAGRAHLVRTWQHCRFDERHCFSGNKAICLELARLSDYGDDDPEDLIRPNKQHAMRLYQQACKLGDARSCNLVGVRLQLGSGATQNDRLAVASFEAACKRGSSAGCYHLARCSDTGRGLTKDRAEARRLYAKACKRGHGDACRVVTSQP